MLKFINSLVVVLLTLSLGTPVYAEERPYTGVVISEVKARYDAASDTDVDEFIELHNDSLSSIALGDYQLHYFNSSYPSDTSVPIRYQLESGILEANGRIVLARELQKIPNSIVLPFSSLSDSGGRLRLVTSEGVIIDEFAWTSTQSQSDLSSHPPVLWQCTSSSVTCTANRSMSFGRVFDALLGYDVNTAHLALGVISPQSSILKFPTVKDPVENTDEPEELAEEVTTPQQTCEGVLISEIMPNPKGADTGKEFIELHNPTAESISLLGCSIQTSANSVQYKFEDIQISAGAYVAFYGAVTGLTLPNASGGTVWLISSDVELNSTIYPGSLEDDMTWSISESGWNKTYTATPDSQNTIVTVKPCADGDVRNEVTGRCQRLVTTTAAILASCAPGQERNPQTNRCRTVVNTSSSLTPCGPGQERNTETNRCRSVITTLNAMVPCKAGQERNPETNRCRNTDQTQSLESCPLGQERNPDTNRCRKTASANGTTLAAVTDVQSISNGFGTEWLIAGGFVLLALGYAIYEWRYELHALLSRFWTRHRR